jgi:hypothetical protein
MTNSERFLEAFAHVSHRVMGRSLQPFTLRHRFWLEAFESPMVTGGTATLLDLEMAARVCAIPYSRLDREVPRMLTRGPGWIPRLAFSLRMLRGRVAVQYAAWQDYLTDHGCPPACHGSGKVSHGGKRYEAMPGILGLVTALVRGSGWPPDTVWSLCPGAAEWYLTGIFIHRGVDMKIKTSHDEEFEEGLRLERREAARKKADGEAAAAATLAQG